MSGRKKATAISLPLSRTAKIMNSAVGVESVNSDIVALATKATVSDPNLDYKCILQRAMKQLTNNPSSTTHCDII